jgi:predicted transposase/invertase (TIGR01784 family)
VVLSHHFLLSVLRLGDLIRNKLADLDQLGLDLQRWMQFWALGLTTEESTMSTILQDTPPVLAAYEEFKRFSADPVMREMVRERERFLTDQRLDRASARKEGREEGIAIGEARGEARGEAKGRTEGSLAKARETASRMKQKGYLIADIAELTGLPPSEIERLD